MGLKLLLNPMLIFLPPFYASEIGLDLATVGLIFFLARSWDALTDPIIGGLSDRTKSRIGRRKPWIIIGTPLLVASSFFLLVPQGNPSVLSLGVTISIFYIFWTMVYIPYLSWGTEVSPNYTQRTRIAGYREAGSVLGILIGIGIPLLLVDPVAEPVRNFFWSEGIGLKSSLGDILKIIFVTTMVLLPLTAFAACFFMHEAPIPNQTNISWHQTLAVIVRNKPFQRLLAGYFLAQLGLLIYLSTLQLLITKALKIDAFLFLIFIQHIIAFMVVPLWVYIGNQVGKHKAFCLSLIVMVCGFLCLNIVPSGNLWIVSLVFILNGLGSSGGTIFPPALAADAVDYDTMRTGSREAGSHIALLNLTSKSTFALSVGISFPLLALAGFDPGAVENSPNSENMLMIIGTLIPCLLMIAGTITMWNFPLNHKKHKIIIKKLEKNLTN